MQVKGKVALVLGAVKGIGKGIGIALANEGAKLVLTRHDWEDAFESMETDFLASRAEHMIITADLCRIKDIERLALSIKEKYGRLDILINNIERGGWP
ncbi:MAG: SDR family NAD(P)-dependent oxidoreductase, partial [Deltaproteobacteria bacterium]|nr:SDR family NAD(P)-dependent oxidoreductase [Candidatus Desulfobacula maris]